MRWVVSMFMTLLLVTSCLPDRDVSPVVGKWKIVAMEADIPELSPETLEAGRKEALSTSYMITRDSTVFMQSENVKDGQSGRWFLDSTKLSFTYENDGRIKQEDYEVEFLPQGKMTWRKDLGEQGSFEMTLKRK